MAFAVTQLDVDNVGCDLAVVDQAAGEREVQAGGVVGDGQVQ